MSILLKNGSVYTGGAFQICDILVENDTIAAVGENLTCTADEVIDCTGKTVLPGLVDLHVHLREPGFTYKETVASGTAAAAAGGYTTVCSMPNLNPVPDTSEHLQLQLDAIKRDACIRVFPFGAITVGEKGQAIADLEAMAPHCIGFSDDGRGVQSEAMMRETMKRVKACGGLISAHCEDESLLEGGAIHKGEYAALHGMKGISSASEYVPIERDIRLVAETGVQYHICHISARESIEAVRRGKAAGIGVTCEVTPHHIALTDMDITEDNGRFKMNPPLRGADDRQAIWAGLQDGTIDCIATDHAPHSEEEKGRGLEKSAFGTVGSETAFAVCYTHLVRTGIVTLEQLAELMSAKPAAIIGRRAEIAVGEAADIAVFDLKEKFTVDPDKFVSMGKSSPFTGMELCGVTELTVCAGNIVYRRR